MKSKIKLDFKKVEIAKLDTVKGGGLAFRTIVNCPYVLTQDCGAATRDLMCEIPKLD